MKIEGQNGTANYKHLVEHNNFMFMKVESQNGTANSVKNNKEIKDKKAYRGGGH